jgi:hypothetical protein
VVYILGALLIFTIFFFMGEHHETGYVEALAHSIGALEGLVRMKKVFWKGMPRVVYEHCVPIIQRP